MKINETGEWASDVDLEYVHQNPDDDSEEASWIKSMESIINQIISGVKDGGFNIELIDIKGFDKYQGPYAIVKIEGKDFKFWGVKEYELYIEDFPIDNQTEDGNNAGFVGNVSDIIDTIIQLLEDKKSETVTEQIIKFENYNG